MPKNIREFYHAKRKRKRMTLTHAHTHNTLKQTKTSKRKFNTTVTYTLTKKTGCETFIKQTFYFRICLVLIPHTQELVEKWCDNETYV